MKTIHKLLVAQSVFVTAISATFASEDPIRVFSRAGTRFARSIADLDGDGLNEIVLAAEVSFHNIILPPEPAELALFVLDHRGNTLPGWPQLLKGSSVTAWFPLSPAIGDIDGNGSQEIVLATNQGLGNLQSKLFAFRKDGSLVSGWPIQAANTSPFANNNSVLADLDNDGDLEVIQMQWVFGAGTLLHAFQGNGAAVTGFPVQLPHAMYALPVVGNVDSDSDKEIVTADRDAGTMYVIGRTGLIENSFSIASSIGMPPIDLTLMNLDADPALEILYRRNSVGSGAAIDGLNANGSSVAGWPMTDPNRFFGRLSLGDITGDGIPEICCSAISSDPSVPGVAPVIYALDRNGSLVPSFPAAAPLYEYHAADILIGDVNGNGIGDLVFSTVVTTPVHHAEAFALDGSGNLLVGFHPVYDSGISWEVSPTLADLDLEGHTDLIHNLGTYDSPPKGYLYAKNLFTPFGPVSHPWPRVLGNNQNNAVIRY